ncbi:MAG TPA: hypothetical protein PLW14_09050 [Chlorobiota bacterium]|nr:hypothetical protein [Chlorobiota bacterium]
MSTEHIMTALGTIIMILLGMISFFAKNAYHKLDEIIEAMARLSERGEAAEANISRQQQELNAILLRQNEHTDRIARLEGERHARDRL